MTRKKWSFLFTVCLVTALIGCGQKNYQVDKNNSEELNKLGQIQVISREEGSGTRDTFASLAGFNKDGADGIDKTVNTATIADSMDSVIETVNKNPSAIGYVSAGTTAIDGVKTLEINGEAVSDNKGKYPLTRSFYLAYSGTLNDVEQDFMTYVQSAGQEIVSEHYETIAKNETFLSNQSEGTIRIEGSTSMAALMKEIADAYVKINTHATIQVTATDSTKGLNSVMSGNCDMAMSSRDLKDEEKSELKEYQIAIDGIAVITNSANKVKDLTLDQVKDIYTGKITNWKEVGGNDADIVVVSREDGSGTRGAFIELFGIEEKKDGEKVDMTTDDAQITNSTSVMLTTVAGDDYAIGYVSLGSLNDTVKALKIDGEEATEQNIKDGKYKICRPFNIATKKGADNEVAKDFIAYIMSKEGQQVISDNGYIGDDSAEAYAGSKPSGKAVVGGSSSVSPVMEKLIEAYKKVNTGAEIELQTTDSTTGMTSAIDGSYDIGMASRELQDEEKDKLDSQVIATDGIAVIVNKNNTTDELSSDQVKTIYTGDATTWDEAVK